MGEMTMIQTLSKRQAGRRKFGKALLLLGLCLVPLAALAQTQIYDSKTKKWVNYDKRKARQYFARNNQVPEAFRRQMVPFRTAEVRARSSSMATSISSISCSPAVRPFATVSA